jgi:hypothetical protein
MGRAERQRRRWAEMRRRCLRRSGLLPTPGFIKQVFYCGICGTCNRQETVSIYETSLVLKVTCGVMVAVVAPCGVVVAVAVVARCLLSWSQPSRHVWCRGHGRHTVLCCGRGCHRAAWCRSCSNRHHVVTFSGPHRHHTSSPSCHCRRGWWLHRGRFLRERTATRPSARMVVREQ